MNYDIILLFVTASVALAISPGPDNIYVLVQSISHGKTFGLVTVIGLTLGCLVHTTLLAFGISAVIKANAIFFFIIKILGAIYLLYLAYSVYKSEDAINFETDIKKKKSLGGLFIQGFFMNVLNPKVTIFFLAFFPGFLFSDDLSTVIQFYILGGIFMLISFVIFSLIALLASAIKRYTLSHKNSGLFFKWLQIVVFIGIAFYILI